MICEITEYERKASVRIKNQEEQRIWHSSNLVNLCLDTWSEKEQQGKLYHMYSREPVVFFSLFEAVNRMEDLYDVISFPQASTNLRSFLTGRGIKACETRADLRISESGRRESKEGEKFDQVMKHRGMRATFLIRVMYRQHSSWQGEVTWVDRQKKEYFRSTLELLRLLDSAIAVEERKDAE